jgi:kynurenine formamidase
MPHLIDCSIAIENDLPSDPPMMIPIIAKEFQKSRDASIIWEGHFAGIEKGYCHMEKLTNLDILPAVGFTFFCFPVKIRGASAGWIRAVALVDD